tara:strand:- start:317 stop:754 length:438 start_codon:yes stop_codon:yes gene_type:complete
MSDEKKLQAGHGKFVKKFASSTVDRAALRAAAKKRYLEKEKKARKRHEKKKRGKKIDRDYAKRQWEEEKRLSKELMGAMKYKPSKFYVKEIEKYGIDPQWALREAVYNAWRKKWDQEEKDRQDRAKERKEWWDKQKKLEKRGKKK